MFQNLGWLPVDLLWQPNGISFLTKAIQSFDFKVIYVFLLICLGFCTVAFWPRLFRTASFIVLFFLIGYSQSFGYFTRLYMPIVWATFFLTISAYVNQAKTIHPDQLSSSNISVLNYSIISLRTIIVFIFFCAGLTKLRHAGIEWFTSDTLRNYLVLGWTWHLDLKFGKLMEIGRFLVSNGWVLKLTAPAVLFLELISPLALFSKRASYVIIPALFLMQQVIKHTMMVNFDLYFGLYLFWIPPSFFFNLRSFMLSLIRDAKKKYPRFRFLNHYL